MPFGKVYRKQYPRKGKRYRNRNMREKQPVRVSNTTRSVAHGKKPALSDWGAIAQDVVNTSSLLGSLYSKINSELKYFDTTIGPTGASNAAWTTLEPLQLIPQGDSVTSRDGNKVLQKKLQFKGIIEPDPLATSGTLLRMVIIKTNDANFSGTDYAPASVYSMRNLLQTNELFSVYDHVFHLGGTGDAYGPHIIDGKFPCDFHLQFEGASTNWPDTNQLWVMFISNQPSLIPIYTINFRIRYYDN